MAAFLFFEPFFKCFHQFIKTAKGFDFGFFFFGKVLFSQLFKPFFGDVDGVHHGLRRNRIKA